jgi:hypothetical protein
MMMEDGKGLSHLFLIGGFQNDFWYFAVTTGIRRTGNKGEIIAVYMEFSKGLLQLFF